MNKEQGRREFVGDLDRTRRQIESGEATSAVTFTVLENEVTVSAFLDSAGEIDFIAAAVQRFLENHGYSLISIADLAEAIAAAEQHERVMN